MNSPDYYYLYKSYKAKYLELRGGGKGDSSSRARKKEGRGRYDPFSSKHIRHFDSLRERFEHQRKADTAPTTTKSKSKKGSKSKKKKRGHR